DRALDVQQQATGTMLAQRKLAEVMIGAVPPSSAGFTAFDDDGMKDWHWKLDVNSNSVTGVYNVQVTVKYDSDGPDFQMELGQMTADPPLRGSSLEAPGAEDGNPNASSSNRSSTNSSGSPPAAGARGAGAPPAGKKTGGGGKTGGG